MLKAKKNYAIENGVEVAKITDKMISDSELGIKGWAECKPTKPNRGTPPKASGNPAGKPKAAPKATTKALGKLPAMKGASQLSAGDNGNELNLRKHINDTLILNSDLRKYKKMCEDDEKLEIGKRKWGFAQSFLSCAKEASKALDTKLSALEEETKEFLESFNSALRAPALMTGLRETEGFAAQLKELCGLYGQYVPDLEKNINLIKEAEKANNKILEQASGKAAAASSGEAAQPSKQKKRRT